MSQSGELSETVVRAEGKASVSGQTSSAAQTPEVTQTPQTPQFRSMFFDDDDASLSEYRDLADKYFSKEQQHAFFDQANTEELSPRGVNRAAKMIINKEVKRRSEIEKDGGYNERVLANNRVADIVLESNGGDASGFKKIVDELNSTAEGSRFLEAYTNAYLKLNEKNRNPGVVPAGASMPSDDVGGINGSNYGSFPEDKQIEFLTKISMGNLKDGACTVEQARKALGEKLNESVRKRMRLF
jgi:hypothetical protein